MKWFIRNSVKEAFDNLPSGICFFDKNGILTLCNHQMYRLFFALTGKDLQSLAEMQELLSDDATAQSRQNQVFLQDDGTAWRFTLETITTSDKKIYTQVIASDVTELYSKKKELEQDPTQCTFIDITKLGLVELTRRKTHLSLPECLKQE